MAICVARVDGVHRLAGDAGLVEIGNRWLGYLAPRVERWGWFVRGTGR